MQPGRCVEFPPFRLDLATHELWRGRERVAVRPKPFTLLAYLATNAERLVPRAELLRAVWPDTHVGEGSLRGYVRDLRELLGDDAEAPRFIETVARLGYRFVATVRVAERRTLDDGGSDAPAPDTVVGRETELRLLEHRLERALDGTRQLVFLAGEPGIGKTTLVDTFISQRVTGRGVWTARGRCVEHFGAGEAYLPVLEAVGDLWRVPDRDQLVSIFARHAPTWLVQMPGLIADAELESVQRRVQGATRERMLREFAEAVEVITAVQPLLLILEDVHWSDDSTIDLLSSLAQRRGTARLLVLCTYRPGEVVSGSHPLAAMKHELQLHGQCEEMTLPSLGMEDVSAFLASRLPGGRLASDLACAIHDATEGNPLFVVNLVDYWMTHGVLAEHDRQWGLDAGLTDGGIGVPDTLRHLIQRQVDRLPSEIRRLLETASVAGGEFSTATVGAVLEEPQERVDEWCEGLAERGLFLRAHGVTHLPDGGIAGRYEFLHALYRQGLYERLADARRARLHRRIGEWEESTTRDGAQERAAMLAVHFERGHDSPRAVHYLESAARNALSKRGHHEATACLARALACLPDLPDTPRRRRQELSLRMALGTSRLMTRGYAAPEVEEAFARARELSRGMEDSPDLVFVLAGLFRFFLARAKLDTARELADQVLRLAEAHDRSLLAVAHGLVAIPILSVADLVQAREHLEHSAALYDFEKHSSIAPEHGDDPALTSLAFLAIALWFLGYPDQALERSRQGAALAERLASPYNVAFAASFSTWIHVRRGEADRAQASSEALMSLAADQGFLFFLAEGSIFRGWALAEQGHLDTGIEQIRDGLAAHRAAGVQLGRPSHLALLAEAYARAGRCDEGLAVVEDARTMVAETGERSYEAELHRLRGDLLREKAKRTGRKSGLETQAEEALRAAAGIARGQGARSLELRALLALCRLRGVQKSSAEARRLLGETYAWFTEGLDTADLRAARALLGVAS